VPGAELSGKPYRAGDIDAGGAAEAQAFVFEQIEDDGNGFLIGIMNAVSTLAPSMIGVTRPRPMPSVIESPGVDFSCAGREQLYIAAPSGRRRR
jgi:hypothetical protein